MKRIRLLNVTFNALIKSHEIPAFRGAIIEKAGKDSILYHNHFGQKKYNYRYPLIQYKTLSQKPCILCIEEGVEEIHKFFNNKNWDIELSGRKLDMSIDSLNLNSFTMQVWDKKWTYSIRNWIALNQQNFKEFETIKEEGEQKEYLSKKLTGNLLSFAKGIDWHVDKQIDVKITSVQRINKVKLKGIPVLGFNLEFTSNMFIPNFIGLGKGASHGYGMVRQKKSNKHKEASK